MTLTTGRIRLLQCVVGILVVGLAASQVDPPFYTTWWFFIATTTAVSATLIEPHYTAPRSAIVNSLIPTGAMFFADRAGVEDLWIALLLIAVVVFVVSTVLVADLGRALTPTFSWVSSRLGRASLLGGAPLFIESVRLSSVSQSDGVWLLAATAVFLAVTSLDWPKVLLPSRLRSKFAVLEAAVSPSLLLFSSESDFPIGQQVSIEKSGSSIPGYVVGKLAHKRASRYQVVADDSWRTMLPEAGAECTITPSTDQDATLGFVVEGTDEVSIRFQPFESVEHGQALLLTSSDGEYLYQVTSLQLERDNWDNSAGLQPRAVAAQIGKLSDNSISLRPWLPKPFQQVNTTNNLTGDLPDGYSLIGHVPGTTLPIGVKTSWDANDGHVGVLGMSGMGKTTVARLLASAFDHESLFITVDGTGEYRGKLGWVVANPIDWEQTGRFVHEPTGEQAVRCEEIIKAAMTIANDEFQDGDPNRRVLLLEEAHSFLPEFNFVTSYAERDTVSRSARYILQARKFGLSFVFVSQRTAVVSKSAISQCENFIILRTIDQTSLDFVESVVGSVFRDAISGLRKYQALCVGPIFNSESPVIIDLLDPATIDTANGED